MMTVMMVLFDAKVKDIDDDPGDIYIMMKCLRVC